MTGVIERNWSLYRKAFLIAPPSLTKGFNFSTKQQLNKEGMATKTYNAKLRDPRWQKKRLEIFQRDGFACKCCGDKESTLNVHHRKYSAKEPWLEPSINLITICDSCHELVHDKAGIKNLRERILKALLQDDGVVFLAISMMNEHKKQGS